MFIAQQTHPHTHWQVQSIQPFTLKLYSTNHATITPSAIAPSSLIPPHYLIKHFEHLHRSIREEECNHILFPCQHAVIHNQTLLIGCAVDEGEEGDRK